MIRKTLALCIVLLFIVSSVGSIGLETQDEMKEIETPDIEPVYGPMDSAWPMFGHDIHNTGRSQYSTEETTDIEKWRFDLDSWLWYASPIIDNDDVIYIGDNDLFAIYPDGTLKWIYDTIYTIQSTPAIDENGIIYAGTVLAHSNLLYAVYSNNGTLNWVYETGDSIFSSPTIGIDGTLYVTAGCDLHAVYPNGTKRWEFPTGQNIFSSPAIGDDGVIYFGSHDHNFYAVNPNGTIKWIYETDDEIHCSPSIGDDGTIYIGSDDEFLYAFYPSNGTLKWKVSVGAMSVSPSIDNEGSLYFGTSDEIFIGVYPNGTIKWTYYLGTNNGVWGSSAAISSDGTIYFGYCINIGYNDGGEIVALGLDGVEKWRKMIASDFIKSSPAIASDGTVYIASTNRLDDPGGEGYLHAFGPVESNDPPNTPTIDGPTEGQVGEEYTYEFSTNDPDNNPVAYFVDWGDGTNSGWTMDYASGLIIPLEHEWSQQDTYTIKVKARDTLGEESDWAYLEVTMPVNQQSTHPLFTWFLERFPNAFPILRHLLEQQM